MAVDGACRPFRAVGRLVSAFPDGLYGMLGRRQAGRRGAGWAGQAGRPSHLASLPEAGQGLGSWQHLFHGSLPSEMTMAMPGG